MAPLKTLQALYMYNNSQLEFCILKSAHGHKHPYRETLLAVFSNMLTADARIHRLSDGNWTFFGV